MMRTRSLIVSVLGVLIATGSVFVANSALVTSENGAETGPALAMVDVVVLTGDVDFGSELSPENFKTQPWPQAALPDGAFLSLAQVFPQDIEGARYARGKMFAGEILLHAKLSEPGELVSLTQKLGENRRAVAIEVDAVTGVGGFVRPEDHVDIVLTEGRNGTLRAGTILQNIRVIGVDQSSETSSEQGGVARTVTVEATPEQSQKLALAQHAGTLSLTLRTLQEAEDATLGMVRLEDLLGARKAPPTPVKIVEERSIRLRRGNVLVPNQDGN